MQILGQLIPGEWIFKNNIVKITIPYQGKSITQKVNEINQFKQIHIKQLQICRDLVYIPYLDGFSCQISTADLQRIINQRHGIQYPKHRISPSKKLQQLKNMLEIRYQKSSQKVKESKRGFRPKLTTLVVDIYKSVKGKLKERFFDDNVKEQLSHGFITKLVEHTNTIAHGEKNSITLLNSDRHTDMQLLQRPEDTKLLAHYIQNDATKYLEENTADELKKTCYTYPPKLDKLSTSQINISDPMSYLHSLIFQAYYADIHNNQQVKTYTMAAILILLQSIYQIYGGLPTADIFRGYSEYYVKCTGKTAAKLSSFYSDLLLMNPDEKVQIIDDAISSKDELKPQLNGRKRK